MQGDAGDASGPLSGFCLGCSYKRFRVLNVEGLGLSAGFQGLRAQHSAV